MHDFPPSFHTAIGELVSQPVTNIRAITGGGYTPAQRLVVTLADGASVFVKRATEPLTAGWIAQEQQVYEGFGEVDFAPRYFGAGATPDAAGTLQPFLVLEDLSHCHWPPPWSPARIDAVLAALDILHATRGEWMQRLPNASVELGGKSGWEDVTKDPAPFLSLGMCSPAWLDAHLPALIQAGRAADFAGDDLLHFDTRSDNICFRPEGQACIVDWNWTSRGNGLIDIAGWLPSLGHETGIAPETVSPSANLFAAWLAGYFAAQAGLPPIPLAPRVREVQTQQLRVALPWAVRTLGLPPPT